MSDERRSGRGRRPSRRGERNRRDEPLGDDDDLDDDAGQREGGGGRRSTRRRSGARKGFDWSAAEDDDERGRDTDEDDEEDREPDDRPRASRRASQPPAGEDKLTLMDLCTPLFGLVSILPRNAGDGQPQYRQFREQVLTALQHLENDAPKHGIEIQDAREASYALSFLIDGQVAGSAWEAKGQWASEPLGIVLQQDPEGGVNFFTRLDALGERQKAVREVYLVCLALGFRGKYAELEATQQAAKIGEIRQKLVRSIHPVPLSKQPELFPEGYTPAASIDQDAPVAPRWWLFASVGTIAAAFLLYLLLLWVAGYTHQPPLKQLEDSTVVRRTDAISLYARTHQAPPLTEDRLP